MQTFEAIFTVEKREWDWRLISRNPFKVKLVTQTASPHGAGRKGASISLLKNLKIESGPKRPR